MRYILAIFLALTCLTACSTLNAMLDDVKDGKDDAGVKEEKETLRYENEGNTVRSFGTGFMAEASYLSPGQADLYFSKFKGGIYKNPFDAKTFIIFSVTAENQSEKTMSYNPRMTLLYLGKGEPVQPKDYASIYATFAFAEAEDIEKRMEAFKAACYDTTVTLAPGEKVQKLLVYPAEEKAKNGMALIVNNIYLDYKSHTIPFTFDKIKN